jgi:hypothetical protein
MNRKMITNEPILRFIQNTTSCDLMVAEWMGIVPVDQGGVGKEKRELLPYAEAVGLCLEFGEGQGRIDWTKCRE